MRKNNKFLKNIFYTNKFDRDSKYLFIEEILTLNRFIKKRIFQSKKTDKFYCITEKGDHHYEGEYYVFDGDTYTYQEVEKTTATINCYRTLLNKELIY